jgi:hypothetical protein
MKFIKIKEKLVFVFLRHFWVFNFFAVKIDTVRIAHFHLLPVVHLQFMVLLPFFTGLVFSSFYCCSAHISDLDFRFFPRFGTFSDAILYTCYLDKSRTVRPIRNKKTLDLIKICWTCPSDQCISGSLHTNNF